MNLVRSVGKSSRWRILAYSGRGFFLYFRKVYGRLALWIPPVYFVVITAAALCYTSHWRHFLLAIGS